MKLIIEWFIYSIFFALMSFICAGYISMSLQIKNADNFFNYAADYLDQRDYTDASLSEIDTLASEKGYTVTYEKTYQNANPYTMEIKYTIKLPILGILKADTIKGYI